MPRYRTNPYLQYIGPVCLAYNWENVSVVNVVQTLVAVDWAIQSCAYVEATVWTNFRGLLDVVTYLLGPLGPLSPLYRVAESVEERPSRLLPREPVKYVTALRWSSIEAVLELFHIKSIEIKRCAWKWVVKYATIYACFTSLTMFMLVMLCFKQCTIFSYITTSILAGSTCGSRCSCARRN